MGHALHRDEIDVGREQTARLMRQADVSGKSKSGSQSVSLMRLLFARTGWSVNSNPGPEQSASGRHYVCTTKKSFVYVAFAIGVHSRRIVR